jgi:hypothetical protein
MKPTTGPRTTAMPVEREQHRPAKGDSLRRQTEQAEAYAKMDWSSTPSSPVQSPVRFELLVLKTAKALGLSVRDPFLKIADEVIR